MLTLKKLIFFIFISLIAHTSSNNECPYKLLKIWKVEHENVVLEVETSEKTNIRTNYFDTNFAYIIEIIDKYDEIFLHSWVGKNSLLSLRKKAAAIIASQIDNIRERSARMPSMTRISEDYEGCSSYFKSVFSVDILCPKIPVLYEVEADEDTNGSSYIVKVPATVEQLNQNYSFFLQSAGEGFIWHGNKTTKGNRNAVFHLCEFIRINNISVDCTKEKSYNDFKSKLEVIEQNMSIDEGPSTDYQQLETTRYSSKYRKIRKYYNNKGRDVTKIVIGLWNLTWDSTYFLMDTLTKEKFIFLGRNSRHNDIRNVMIEAETFIFKNPGKYPMMEIVQPPHKGYIKLPHGLILQIPHRPPLNFLILFSKPLKIIVSLIEYYRTVVGSRFK